MLGFIVILKCGKREFLLGAIVMLCSSYSLPSSAADCVDSDGDGWGWDGSNSCIVGSPSSSSDNSTQCVDSDGDGWGWDGSNSCIVGSPSSSSDNNNAQCIDTPPLLDGWGWDGTSSCRPSNLDGHYSGACVSNNGLYGWNGSGSCTISRFSPNAYSVFGHKVTPCYGPNEHYGLCDSIITPQYISPCFPISANEDSFAHWNGTDQLTGSTQECNRIRYNMQVDQIYGAVILSWASLIENRELYGGFSDYGNPIFGNYQVYRNGVHIGSTNNERFVDRPPVQQKNSIYTVVSVSGDFRIERVVYVEYSDIRSRSEFIDHVTTVGIESVIDRLSEVQGLSDDLGIIALGVGIGGIIDYSSPTLMHGLVVGTVAGITAAIISDNINSAEALSDFMTVVNMALNELGIPSLPTADDSTRLPPATFQERLEQFQLEEDLAMRIHTIMSRINWSTIPAPQIAKTIVSIVNDVVSSTDFDGLSFDRYSGVTISSFRGEISQSVDGDGDGDGGNQDNDNNEEEDNNNGPTVTAVPDPGPTPIAGPLP